MEDGILLIFKGNFIFNEKLGYFLNNFQEEDSLAVRQTLEDIL